MGTGIDTPWHLDRALSPSQVKSHTVVVRLFVTGSARLGRCRAHPSDGHKGQDAASHLVSIMEIEGVLEGSSKQMK